MPTVVCVSVRSGSYWESKGKGYQAAPDPAGGGAGLYFDGPLVELIQWVCAVYACSHASCGPIRVYGSLQC